MAGKDDKPAGGPSVKGQKDLDQNELAAMKLKVQSLYLDKIAGRKKGQEPAKNFKFWKTQPVPQFDDEDTNATDVGPIESSVPTSEVRQTPLNLPDAFEWDTLDISSDEHVNELYTLLSNNYVEDDDAQFRFDYRPDFLQWALMTPGFVRDWHLGVRVKSSKKLVGFISGIPAEIKTFGQVEKMVEINFLCVIKKLRTKRLAPVLIKEITRRVNLRGVFQATYTSGTLLPKPTATIRYYHRSLNLKKLVDIKFSQIPARRTLQSQLKIYKLPEVTETPGFRAIEEKDVPRACKMLNEYLAQFKIRPTFTEVEFKHYFVTRRDVVYGWVVEDPVTHEITDFVSYYLIPSKVLCSEKYKEMVAAFMYYSFHTKTDYKQLVNDALIVAAKAGIDVFNALACQKHMDFLKELRFGEGDGNLNYYFYNYRCPHIEDHEEGIILL